MLDVVATVPTGFNQPKTLSGIETYGDIGKRDRD